MKKKQIFLIIILVIVLSLGLSLGRKPLSHVAILESNRALRIIGGAGRHVAKSFDFISSISSLRKENQDLTNKLESLEVDRSKIAELDYENKLLEQELGFTQQNKSFEVVSARIIGREPTSFLDYVMVDRGSDDGVKNNAAVISNGALVGQVKEVTAKTAKIVLVTSKDSNTLVMLQDSRAKGILKGGIAGLLMDDIVQDVEVKPGEDVITSGLDGEIPQGILVGKTGALKSSPSDLFQRVSVEPTVDFSKLEIIFIQK